MPRISPFQNVIVVLALILASPQLGEAAIDLSSGSWTTTYNCAEQANGGAGWVTCDGLQSYGSWMPTTGEQEQITTVANMAAGSGGRGQRHWIGNGRNNNSGSMEFCMTTPQSEVWIRYYTRWQSGYFMSAQHSQKMIYARDAGARPYIDTYGGDGLRIVTNSTIYQTSSGVWNTMFNGQVSDGTWHEFQFHLKANGANGGADVWVDGVKVLTVTGFDWGSITNWQCFAFPENVDSNATGVTMYQDLDDLAVSTMGYIPSLSSRPTVLFNEDFENANLAAKGWYDNMNQTFSTVEHIPGSTQSLEYHWTIGGTQPTSGGSIRRAFTPTSTLGISYWVKYSSNYAGSGRIYHPHELYVLTNADPAYSGLSFNTLDLYIQQVFGSNGGVPQLEIQDGKMVDTTKIGVNLINVTENRAVAGCNGVGNTGGVTVNNVFGGSDCYSVGGGTYWNSYMWNSLTARFIPNTWHHVEVYAQLNSVVGGIGQTNGVLRYWLDGAIIIDQSNVIFRTGANSNLAFNQFVIAPYIGDGSPVDQKFWIDNLTLATSRVTDLVPPAPPQNLMIQ
jgi:hypothetical protein